MTKEMLMQDQEFVTYIMGLENEEEVKKAFAAKGCEITDEEIDALGALIEVATAEQGELSEDEMDQVAGGGPLAVIGGILTFSMAAYEFLKNNPEVVRAAKKGIKWAKNKLKKLGIKF